MGFYGNITNTSKTNFVFDKIYTNRKAMDENMLNDGIFIGRYVLVEYGQITNDSFIRVYKFDDVFYITNEKNDNTKVLYTDNKTKVEGRYITNGIIIYTLEQQTINGVKKDIYKYYECNGGVIDGIPTFTEDSPIDPNNDPYFYNFNQDRAVQKYDTSRGYDGTVWVKTSVNNTIKYVNIAELNSVVPSFEMVADAPTMSPILPHFDTASNNVYYKLHWQPAWGMRIAAADNAERSDYNTTWSQEYYNKETGKAYTKWYNPATGKWDSDSPCEIAADIYFNRDAFEAQVGEDNIHGVVKGMNDYIGITADGLSGNEYSSHDNTSAAEPKIDTQQIHINLPAIGNMMSEAWDIIHGKQRNDYRGDGENASLQGRLDAFGGIEKNQIPIKRNDGTIIGSKINNGIDFDYQGNDSKEILDELIATIPEGKKSLAHDDPWIRVNVDTTDLEGGTKIGENPSQANNNGVLIQHTFHSTENSTSTLDMNSGDNTTSTDTYKKDYLNVKNVDAGKDNDDIKLYTPYVDKAGHVVGYNEETITLPYSFKTITAINSTNTDKWSQSNGAISSKNENVKNIVADNTKDTFNFKGGNKWIRFKTDANTGEDTDNNTTTPDGNNTLTIAHETHNIVTTPLVSDFNDEEDIKYIKINLTNSEYKKGKYYWYNNTTKKYEIDNNDTLVSGREHFIVNDKIAFQDLKFDTAGHVTDNQTHTYTLPYGYKYFETEGLSNEHEKDLYTKNADNGAGSSEEKDTEGIANKTEAHNTQDLLTINPANKWIQTQFVDNDGRQDELVIAHEIHSIDERDSENGDKDASNKGTSHTNLNKETGATNEINLTMYDWSYDKAGHITSKRKHTYTLPFGYKTFTDGANSSVANSTQDTFKFIGDSWLKPIVANDQITYTHIGPVATTAQNLGNETPKFGDTFKIEDWSFDSKGHKANRSTHTIKIPGLSLTNDTTGNVVTNIEYAYDTTNHKGSFTETRENIGTLTLGTHTGTTTTTNGLNILNSDTISEAFDKTQTHINSLILDNSSTTEFISKITQTDGQVAVERAAAGTLVLGKANTDYSVPATADTIVYNDSLATAFGKVEAQIKAETAARQKEIADLINSAPEALDTLGELAAWINNDKTGAAAMANDIAILKGTDTTNGSVKKSIKDAIAKLDSSAAVSNTSTNYLTGITIVDGKITGKTEGALGSAAFTEASNYATAEQGAKANTAIQLDTEIAYKIQQDNGEGGTTEVELKTTIEEMAKEIASLKQILKDNGLITE